MRVAHVAAELAPWCSSGGLGAVMAALPDAIAAQGPQVDVYVPLCRRAAAEVDLDAPWELSWDGPPAQVRTRPGPGASIHFLDIPEWFDRPTLYGPHGNPYPDDAERFVGFADAAMAAATRIGTPDIVHGHDWHAALVARHSPSVLTIHNIGYRGPAVPGDGRSFLEAGIELADVVTTVSPTHAMEITTPEGGAGLHAAFEHKQPIGIRNGIDLAAWDPERNPALPHAFSAASPDGKAANRSAMLDEMGLPDDGALVAAVVSRLAEQKGIDLIASLGPALEDLDAQLVIVGDGDPAIEAALSELAATQSERVAFRRGWAPELAHRVIAGSDVLLMPSRYEPGGLTQMEAMRYGTLPVVHATGGLADTVEHGVTGFTFTPAGPDALLQAVMEAAHVRRDEPQRWSEMVAGAMRRDWSWDVPARRYVELYTAITG